MADQGVVVSVLKIMADILLLQCEIRVLIICLLHMAVSLKLLPLRSSHPMLPPTPNRLPLQQLLLRGRRFSPRTLPMDLAPEITCLTIPPIQAEVAVDKLALKAPTSKSEVRRTIPMPPPTQPHTAGRPEIMCSLAEDPARFQNSIRGCSAPPSTPSLESRTKVLRHTGCHSEKRECTFV